MTRAKRKRRSELLEWVLSLLLAGALALLVHLFLGQQVVVKGNSMLPTLQNGQRLIASRITYLLGEPQVGDIVVVHYPNRSENFIKRVVAVGGDTVSVQGGTLYRNGAPVSEDYISAPMLYTLAETQVPAGHVFVLGDNRNDSQDSHMAAVGTLPLYQVYAKAVLRIWPPAAFGSPYEP